MDITIFPAFLWGGMAAGRLSPPEPKYICNRVEKTAKSSEGKSQIAERYNKTNIRESPSRQANYNKPLVINETKSSVGTLTNKMQKGLRGRANYGDCVLSKIENKLSCQYILLEKLSILRCRGAVVTAAAC